MSKNKYYNTVERAIAEANRLVESMSLLELKQFTFDRLVDELMGDYWDANEETRQGDPGDEQY